MSFDFAPAGAEYLRAYLNLLWLRPESAVLCACHAQVLSRYLDSGPDGSLAELCCGDGTFSFILQGGRFAPQWDAFEATTRFRRSGGSGNDIFDHFDESYRPQIEQPPFRHVDLGVDLRESMLRRAAALDLYRDLRAGDLAKPMAPEPPAYHRVLLLQSINHIPDPGRAASNLYAATAPGGVAYVTTYDPSFCEFYAQLDRGFAPEWVGLVERNMRQAWPIQFSVDGWTALFRTAGFRDISVVPLLNRQFAPVWNIGLRPLAPLLIRVAELARAHNQQELAEIKAEWTGLFRELAAPFVEPAPRVSEAGTHLYVLYRG